MINAERDPHTARWSSDLRDCGVLAGFVEPMQISGRITRVAGLVMDCVGLRLAVGAACTIPMPSGAQVEAEVVGFDGERLFLMPQSDVEGIVPGTRVFPVEPQVPRPGSVTHPRRRPSDRSPSLSDCNSPRRSPASGPPAGGTAVGRSGSAPPGQA